MAIVESCNAVDSVKNPNSECHKAMVATKMLGLLFPGTKFTLADLTDPIAFFQNLIQERKFFPLFGNKFPINTINNNPENDIQVTLDDGTIVFLRYGVYNRTFETIKGGLCYADALQSFLNSGYSLIEIDQQGQMLVKKLNTTEYTGLTTSFMYAPSPVMPDFTSTPYKNRFQVSYTPTEMVQSGKILSGGSALLDLVGLLDVDISSAQAASTTKLYLNVKTHCAGDDLLVKFPADIIEVTNYIVKNKATGVVVTPSGGAIVSGKLELTGTYVSGQTYVVTGSAPSVWYANDIEGYDGSVSSIEIEIP